MLELSSNVSRSLGSKAVTDDTGPTKLSRLYAKEELSLGTSAPSCRPDVSQIVSGEADWYI